GDFDLFRNRAGFERDGNSSGFCDSDFNIFGFCLGETGLVDDNDVATRRQQRSDEFSIGVDRHSTRQNLGTSTYDLNLGAAHRGAAGIDDRAADGPGGAALWVNAIAEESRKQKHQNAKLMNAAHNSPSDRAALAAV